jgi:hypothetical protein
VASPELEGTSAERPLLFWDWILTLYCLKLLSRPEMVYERAEPGTVMVSHGLLVELASR